MRAARAIIARHNPNFLCEDVTDVSMAFVHVSDGGQPTIIRTTKYTASNIFYTAVNHTFVDTSAYYMQITQDDARLELCFETVGTSWLRRAVALLASIPDACSVSCIRRVGLALYNKRNHDYNC